MKLLARSLQEFRSILEQYMPEIRKGEIILLYKFSSDEINDEERNFVIQSIHQYHTESWLAHGVKTPVNFLEELFEKGYHRELSSNPSLPQRLITKLSFSNDKEILANILGNQSTGEHVMISIFFEKLDFYKYRGGHIDEEFKNIIQALVSNPNIPIELYRKMDFVKLYEIDLALFALNEFLKSAFVPTFVIERIIVSKIGNIESERRNPIFDKVIQRQDLTSNFIELLVTRYSISELRNFHSYDNKPESTWTNFFNNVIMHPNTSTETKKMIFQDPSFRSYVSKELEENKIYREFQRGIFKKIFSL